MRYGGGGIGAIFQRRHHELRFSFNTFSFYAVELYWTYALNFIFRAYVVICLIVLTPIGIWLINWLTAPMDTLDTFFGGNLETYASKKCCRELCKKTMRGGGGGGLVVKKWYGWSNKVLFKFTTLHCLAGLVPLPQRPNIAKWIRSNC